MSEQENVSLDLEEKARLWLLNEIEDGKRTQADIARAVGIGGSTLNRFIKGNYPNPISIVEKINMLMENEEQRKLSPKAPDFTTTSISKRVLDAIEYCNLLQVGGVIYGDAGVGKTMSIREYAKTNPLCIYITASPLFSTISGMNDLIAEELGCKEKNSKKLYLDFIDKLKGTNRILIIDEAQHLTRKTLDYIRSLGDATGIGYCLVGNTSLYKTIQGKGGDDFAQVANRMARPQEVFVMNISKDDIESIFSLAKLDDDCIDFLYKISKTKYAIRGAVNLYVATVALFESINLSSLQKVAMQMRITVGR